MVVKAAVLEPFWYEITHLISLVWSFLEGICGVCSIACERNLWVAILASGINSDKDIHINLV